MGKTFAVYYLMPDMLSLIIDTLDLESPTDQIKPKLTRRYVHPDPAVRRLQDEPVWTDRATADRLAKEYGGAIVFKCPTTGQPLDKEPTQ